VTKEPKVSKKILSLIKKKSGYAIDVGCGSNKQTSGGNWIGMDRRKTPVVDIVHDAEVFPWPFPAKSCNKILMSHLIEHIKPWLMIDLMDECWRVLKLGGQLLIAVPYATSFGYYQDPTHCLINGSEIFTESGFKKIQDIKINEKILTLNTENNLTEYSKCLKIIDEEYKGEMVYFKNKRMNIVTTPNHDMLWRTWSVTTKLKKIRADELSDKLKAQKHGISVIPNWIGKNPDKIDGYDAGDYMELMGWILSEGCFSTSNIIIFQSQGENYEKISNLMDRMKLKKTRRERSICIKNKLLFDSLKYLGKQDCRYVPPELKKMSILLLSRMLESLLLGDGECHVNGGGHSYTTISEKLASDVNEIALKCGYRSSIKKRKSKEFLAPNGKKYIRKKQYRISICEGKDSIYTKAEIKKYDGRIVCVTVAKNNTIFVRYKGQSIWTGNCNPCNESTFHYFDPKKYLFRIYEPKPWSLVRNAYQTNGNMEIILEKMSESQMHAIPEWKNMKKSQEAAWKKNIEEGVHSEDNKK